GGAAMLVVGSAADLDEHEHVAVTRDDVELARFAAKVTLDDPVAGADEQLHGMGFCRGPTPDLVVHDPRTLLLPENAAPDEAGPNTGSAWIQDDPTRSFYPSCPSCALSSPSP